MYIFVVRFYSMSSTETKNENKHDDEEERRIEQLFSPSYQEREEEERLKAQLQVEQQTSLTSSDKTTEPSTFERNDSLLDKGLPNCTCIYTCTCM